MNNLKPGTVVVLHASPNGQIDEQIAVVLRETTTLWYDQEVPSYEVWVLTDYLEGGELNHIATCQKTEIKAVVDIKPPSNVPEAWL